MYDLPRKKKLNKIVIRKHQNFVFFPKLKKKKDYSERSVINPNDWNTSAILCILCYVIYICIYMKFGKPWITTFN